MTREIKFRGFNRKNKQWLYGFYLQNRGYHFVCPDEWATGKLWDDYQVEPETVGQFTGLKDKNGKEIYEGDILQLESFGHCFVWHNGEHCTHELRTQLTDGGFVDKLWSLNCDKYEVIGNIIDNPDLLQRET